MRLRALQPGRGRRLSVFYTEFGYQTTPPDPFAGVSLNQQRLYIQQAAYIAQRTPRVRGLNQFRLTDGAIAGKGLRRFEEFQSGLMFRNRKPKPAYSVFAHPFVISGDRFWGQVRPGGSHTVRVQRKRHRARLAGAWWPRSPPTAWATSRSACAGASPGYYRYLYEAAQALRAPSACGAEPGSCTKSCILRGLPSAPRPSLYEHMFPRMRQRIGTALIDRIDLLVEFSTLGEYALADDLRPVAMHADTPAPSARRSRDDCPWRERAAQPALRRLSSLLNHSSGSGFLPSVDASSSTNRSNSVQVGDRARACRRSAPRRGGRCAAACARSRTAGRAAPARPAAARRPGSPRRSGGRAWRGGSPPCAGARG